LNGNCDLSDVKSVAEFCQPVMEVHSHTPNQVVHMARLLIMEAGISIADPP